VPFAEIARAVMFTVAPSGTSSAGSTVAVTAGRTGPEVPPGKPTSIRNASLAFPCPRSESCPVARYSPGVVYVVDAEAPVAVAPFPNVQTVAVTFEE